MQSESINVPFTLTDNYSTAPTFGSASAAGADLYASLPTDVNVIINPGETKMISAGIKTEIPEGYVGLIFARSGLATKQGLAPANKVGVIDSDYRGEWFVALHNHSNEAKSISSGERIAQVIIMPVPKFQFEQVQELNSTERGEGGFGSTGK